MVQLLERDLEDVVVSLGYTGSADGRLSALRAKAVLRRAEHARSGARLGPTTLKSRSQLANILEDSFQETNLRGQGDTPSLSDGGLFLRVT